MKIKPTFGCHLTAYLLLSTCLGTAALAQDTTTFLETITLTTDRAGGTILDVPSNTTVVDEDQIEGRDIDDLEDLVRTVPGVDISRQTSSTDPFNSIGGVTIRGVGGNRVALQVDGSRVAERITDGTRDYFDLSFTKQAEIVRGPASVLWGADALGGIIALETLDPEDLLEGRERGGRSTLSFDSLNDRMTGEAAFAQSFGSNLEVLLGYKREQSHEIEKSKARDDGGIMPCSREVAYGATTCGETDPLNEKTDRLLAKAVWTPNAEQRLEFSADILQRETHVDQLLDLSATNHSRTRDLDLSRHRYGIEHTWTPGSNVISEVKTTLAYTPHSYESRSNKIFTNTGGDMIRDYDVLNYYEDFLELDVQATAEFSTGAADHRVIFGFDGDTTSTDYQRISQETNLTTGIADAPEYAGGFNFANAQTQRADLYVEDRITLGNGLELTPGLRLATYKIDPQPDIDYQIVPGAEPNVRKSTKLLKSLGL
ncbi:MAG: TonB-dependent receptor, partial [Pseudomonadota bacterium]|nr:TonB-dependent receptor [Pseudomonadota bacterium]